MNSITVDDCVCKISDLFAFKNQQLLTKYYRAIFYNYLLKSGIEEVYKSCNASESFVERIVNNIKRLLNSG